MLSFENILFLTLTENFVEKPKHLSIYVDDCFIIWNNSCGNIDSYLRNLNQLRPRNIKFKIELEVNNKLPILDLLLTRHESKITFEIYRKPTNVNRFLNFKSNHSISSKIAVIDSQIRRAMILNGKQFDKEISFVKKILLNNGYPISFINSRIRILTNKVFDTEKEKID